MPVRSIGSSPTLHGVNHTLLEGMEDDIVDDIKRVVRQAVANPVGNNLARQIKESLDNEIVLEDEDEHWNCMVITRDGKSNYCTGSNFMKILST